MKKALAVVSLCLAACGGSSPRPADPPVTVAEPWVEAANPSPSQESEREAAPMQLAESGPGQWDVYPSQTDREPPSAPTPIATSPSSPESQLLPENFAVYVNGYTVINHPARGFQRKVLPTVNDFRGTPGCYVACYSHDEQRGVYPVSNSIFVMGQVRVPGRYEARVCLPDRYGRSDISAAQGIKELCKASIPDCGTGCWGGGDTGGWFGIP